MNDHANEVRLAGWERNSRTGQVRLEYHIDGKSHAVNALFHQAPLLDPGLWELCLQDLALACVIDVANASLARRITATGQFPAALARSWMSGAVKALRMECLAEHSLSLRHLHFDMRLQGTETRSRALPAPNQERVLLLMGGGKDSLYSYELLRAAGFDVECFYMVEACRTWQQLRRTHERLSGEAVQHRAFLNANQTGRLEARYGRDYPVQFQIGQAIFLSVPYALARGCRYIAVGAERSANERSGHYRGMPVLHQYEKSAVYFAILNRYFGERYGGAVQVFSPLHGLYDLGIYARFLARGKRFVGLQSSCGGSNSYRRHCGACEKCAFVAALFTALSSDTRAFRKMFPVNPLDDVELFDEWYRGRFERPLACVGSLRELRVALRLGRARGRKHPIHDFDRDFAAPPGPAALKHYLASHENRSLPEALGRRILPHLKYDSGHLVELLAGGVA